MITRNDVLTTLSRHIGADNGIHMDDLVWAVTGFRAGAGGDARRIRNLIVELRLEGHHICGTPSTGYYMAGTAEELDRTCLFLYDRAMTTLEQISRMKRIALPDLRGQLKLPT